jgi:hypothetical protein
MNLLGKKNTIKPEDKLGIGEKIIDRKEEETESGLKLVGMFSESKKARYMMAIEKKAILLDKEGDDGVDYTHMDFILSIAKFERGMTNFVAIKTFWATFWPYLRGVVEKYEEFYDRFRTMIDDQEEVLRNHAELDYKYKWTVEYIKSSGQQDKYNKFIRQNIAEIKKKQKDNKTAPSEEMPDLIIE